MRPEFDELERRNRQQDNVGRNFLAIVAAVILAFVAGMKFVESKKRDPVPVAAPVANSTAISAPDVRPPRAIVSPSPYVSMPHQAPHPRSGSASEVQVYKCVVNGQKVFSGQPCGAGAELKTLVVNQPDPRQVALQRQRVWQAQQQASSGAAYTNRPRTSAGSTQAVVQRNAAACASIEQRLEWLNSRMRQGYTSQQGELLRAEEHSLRDRRQELKCKR